MAKHSKSPNVPDPGLERGGPGTPAPQEIQASQDQRRQPDTVAQVGHEFRNRNIFLVGPMGAGKTTIGKRLAKSLGLEFFDLDRELEARTGADVSLIFDIEGEPGFRRRESELLSELAETKGVLVATGGGTVLDPDNQKILTRSGLVVFLKATVEQQLDRLRRDKQRPLLQTADRRERLSALAAERDPIYQRVADLVVVSDGRSVAAMARWVGKRLEQEFSIYKREPGDDNTDTSPSGDQNGK